MKKIILPVVLFLGGMLTATAQTNIEQNAVSAAGDYYTGSFGSLQVNIGGEPVIETITDGTTTFTQGFEQPKFKGTGIISLPANAPEIKLFPNPSSDMVNLMYTLTQGGKITYQLFDMAGRALGGTSHATQQGQQTEQLDVSSLSQGVYMLNIVFEANDATKSFSVVKRIEIVK